MLWCADVLVQHHHTLQYLNLYRNSIGDDGAKALAEALKVRRELVMNDESGSSGRVCGAERGARGDLQRVNHVGTPEFDTNREVTESAECGAIKPL
jgi:hypothetical protein